MPKQKWWAEVNAEFTKRAKPYSNAQKRMGEEVRARRAYLKSMDEGDCPSTSAYDRHIDDWIAFLDDLDERQQTAKTAAKEAKENEANAIVELQKRQLQTLGKRQREQSRSSEAWEYSPTSLESQEGDDEVQELPTSRDSVSRRGSSRGRSVSAKTRLARSKQRGESHQKRAVDRLADAAEQLAAKDLGGGSGSEERFEALEKEVSETKETVTGIERTVTETHELLRALLRGGGGLPSPVNFAYMPQGEAAYSQNAAKFG